MPGSGTSIFAEPGDYLAQLPGTRELLATQPVPFQARLTWVQLPRLHLLRAQEAVSRVRYVTLPPGRAFVVFPLHRDTVLICGGIEVRPGDLMLHALGERFHERTTGACRWGLVSLPAEALSVFSQTLIGHDISPPSIGGVLRPGAADRLRFLRLHARAMRTAETKLDHLGHPEVARALEDELVWTLVECLATRNRHDCASIGASEPIMVRFEEVLAAHPDHVPALGEISNAIGVSEPSLHACCLKVVGMNPAKYLYLRRLMLVRSLLMCAGPTGPCTTDIARMHGFADLHHFATEYRRAFGDMPPQPWRTPAG